MSRSSGKGGTGTPRKDARALKTRVKTARGRRISSTRWLQRQLNDPYVTAAKREGYRSRSAFKLIEIDDKHHILKPGTGVLDLGAAPGGWCQVAARRVGALKNKGRVLGIDMITMEAIPGVELMKMDFLDEDAPERIREALGRTHVDVVMSDMAAHATGHRQTDHLKIMALCEAALEFALEVLAPDGVFLAKVLQGGAEGALLTSMRQNFRSIRHVKPAASRADSAEMYVLASGFRGAAL